MATYDSGQIVFDPAGVSPTRKIDIDYTESRSESVAARLLADGDITVAAGRDVLLEGAHTAAGRDVVIVAGRNIEQRGAANSLEASSDIDGVYTRVHDEQSAGDFLASETSAGGDLTLHAGDSIRNIGSRIVAAGDINVSATNEFLQDTQGQINRTEHDQSASQVLAKSDETRKASLVRASTVSTGGDVNIYVRDGDVLNRGSSIAAANNVDIEAGGNVILEASVLEAESKDHGPSRRGAGVVYDKTKDNLNTAAEISSIYGDNIRIDAGNNVEGRGVLLIADGDIDVQASNDIIFDSEAIERYTETDGWSLGFDIFGLGSLIEAATNDDTNSDDVLREVANLNDSTRTLYNASKTDSESERWQNLALSAYYANEESQGNSNAGGEVNNTDAEGGDAVSGGDVGGFDVSSGISVRLGQHRSKDSWTETVFSGLNAGGDINLEAGRDLQLHGGTSVNAAEDITLIAGRDLDIRSAEQVQDSHSSGEGIKVGYNGSWYVGIDGRSDNLESNGYSNASVIAGGKLTTESGRDTVIEGGNLHGAEVDMTVGGDLQLLSQQSTLEQDSTSGSASFSFGSGDSGGNSGGNSSGSAGANSGGSKSSSYGGAVSRSERERIAVENQSSITSSGKLTIDVADNTHLAGSVINSETGDLTLITESLTWENFENDDDAWKGSASYSSRNNSSNGDGQSEGAQGANNGSSSANNGNGEGKKEQGGFSAGVPTVNHEGNTTRAAIGEGVIKNQTIGQSLLEK